MRSLVAPLCSGGTSHRRTSIVLALLLGLAVAGAAAAWLSYGWDPRTGDGWNYLAAGERLNAGHELYGLEPGDRPVVTVPPYWTVPLLAPPPIAVAWRPLASMGEASLVLWALAAILAVAWAVTRTSPVGWALLAMPVTLTALSGNASAFVLAAFVVTWLKRDHPMVTGTMIALTAAVKLTPLVMVVWLLATRRWRAVLVCASAGSLLLLASFVIAGPAAWLDWLSSVPKSAPSPMAISAMTGLDTWVVALAAALAVVAVWVGSRRDRATFNAAVIAAALATPALYFQALALLLALFVRDDPGWAHGIGRKLASLWSRHRSDR